MYGGTPKSSILTEFSPTIHLLGYPHDYGNLHLAKFRRRNHIAKAFRVAQILGGCTMAVSVSPSVSPASRRVEEKSKTRPGDDKSPGRSREEDQDMPKMLMKQTGIFSDLR